MYTVACVREGLPSHSMCMCVYSACACSYSLCMFLYSLCVCVCVCVCAKLVCAFMLGVCANTLCT